MPPQTLTDEEILVTRFDTSSDPGARPRSAWDTDGTDGDTDGTDGGDTDGTDGTDGPGDADGTDPKG
jgi:hypothetical protein